MTSTLVDVTSTATHRDTRELPAVRADAVSDYLDRIGPIPTLNAEDEVEYSMRIEAGLAAADRMATTQSVTETRWFPAEPTAEPTTEPTAAELEALMRDGRVAYRSFVQGNLKLVVAVAKHYTGHGLAMIDLIQNGNLGLDRAVKSFDYRLGYKFSTHAVWWIRQAIWSSLAAEARTIRIPVHAMEKLNWLRRVKQDFAGAHGREPSDHELASAAKLPIEEVRRLVFAGLEPVSLDVAVGVDDEAEFGELIVDEGTLLVSELVDLKIARQAVRARVAQLPARESDLLRMRFGLDGSDPMTLSRIGVALGVSKQRARQLELRALEWLRCPELRAYL